MLIKFEFLSQMLADLQLFARNHNVNSKDIDSEYNDDINYQQDIKNFLHKYMILMSMSHNKQKVFAQKYEKDSYYWNKIMIMSCQLKCKMSHNLFLYYNENKSETWSVIMKLTLQNLQTVTNLQEIQIKTCHLKQLCKNDYVETFSQIFHMTSEEKEISMINRTLSKLEWTELIIILCLKKIDHQLNNFYKKWDLMIWESQRLHGIHKCFF